MLRKFFPVRYDLVSDAFGPYAMPLLDYGPFASFALDLAILLFIYGTKKLIYSPEHGINMEFVRYFVFAWSMLNDKVLHFFVLLSCFFLFRYFFGN